MSKSSNSLSNITTKQLSSFIITDPTNYNQNILEDLQQIFRPKINMDRLDQEETKYCTLSLVKSCTKEETKSILEKN